MPFVWGEELAGILPNSRFVRIAGAGHNFIVADTPATTKAVLEFIDEADKAAG